MDTAAQRGARTPTPASRLPLTPFHERLFAEELTLKAGDQTTRLAPALSEARIDLNPHQVEAAAFALEALDRGGCLLADEVGLGKTIEAGIVIGQLVAEGRDRVLILCPATLRAQWQLELAEKFGLSARVVDARALRGNASPFEARGVVICSLPFGAGRSELLSKVSWDLVVIDEAHRLRNAYKPSHKTGKALKSALRGRPKLLLSATPLQNDLLELFGLLSILDEEILGPEHAFRARYPVGAEGELSPAAMSELRDRLAPVVHRTLRRQVKEYVRFTNRRSLVEDFEPGQQEQDLYEKVSEYLRRADAAAIEPGKKTLLALVYRKLLASSTYAIAPTLRKLAQSLEARLSAAKLGRAADQLFEPEEVRQYSEESEEWSDDPARSPTVEALQREAWELNQYADLAERITHNAKGEALRRALDRAFAVARTHHWPQKAVVFTESRRTQEYLLSLLSDHGYRGKVSVLSGDASTAEERAALIAEFRDHTQVLLSTEAGAEGLNLQFCNLVVNYDLPWNPQRIEQRIGRCHRYGQQRDVLVLNFLNRRNSADARLYELLEKKLNLFDGVFGASDEILGALESGVDFEKRVLEIYQSCRHPEEIDAAFGALRKDLEQRISRRMTEARSLLMERFDGEVRRKLRLAGERAREAIERRRRSAQAVFGSDVPLGSAEVARAADAVRARERELVSYLRLDASSLPAKLAKLAGSEGWWFAYKFSTSGLKSDERLVQLVLLQDGDRFRVLPPDDAECFPLLPGQVEPTRRPSGGSISSMHEQALKLARDELVGQIELQSERQVDQTREKLDRYAEDCLLKPRQDVHSARADWEESRRTFVACEDAAERKKLRALVLRSEREYRKKLSLLRAEEDRRYGEKDQALAALTQKAKVTERRQLVASAYFWLS